MVLPENPHGELESEIYAANCHVRHEPCTEEFLDSALFIFQDLGDEAGVRAAKKLIDLAKAVREFADSRSK